LILQSSRPREWKSFNETSNDFFNSMRQARNFPGQASLPED
jgi:hypothetical protein